MEKCIFSWKYANTSYWYNLHCRAIIYIESFAGEKFSMGWERYKRMEGFCMNRKLSFCILILLGILLLAGIWVGFSRRENSNETNELPVPQTQADTEITIAASTHTPQEYAYIIRTEDAMLVVYQGDGENVFMQTGIRADRLSKDLQNKAKRGIGFANLEQLYDFLESYAS